MRLHPALWLLIGILAIGAFFRFYQITEIPPGLYPDEAMNGNNALEVTRNFDLLKFRVFYPENNGREGLYINLQAIALSLLGNEAWVLRLISAIIGTLTILGVYLLTIELWAVSPLQKSQNTNYKLQTNPNNQNSKSQTHVLNLEFRNWDLFRIWNLEFGISRGQLLGLLSSFFLATSYWHINFSRIGFRAILVPFLATFGLYFLFRGLRTKKVSPFVWAGIFIGLGFHTYIAWRFMPFVIAVPILWYLWKWIRGKSLQPTTYNLQPKPCAPCAILLFLFVTFIVALPIGWYFLENPQDFFGRAADVSVFSAQSPVMEFIKSNLATLGMFFFRGDCNWRHNLPCRPELHPIVAVFFIIGIVIAIQNLFTAARKLQITNYKLQTISKTQNTNERNKRVWNFADWNLFGIWNLEFGILLIWLIFMSFPATLTREGLPHALRAIGMLPPVMILAGLGACWTITKTLEWIENRKEKWPQYRRQLLRIHYEVLVLFLLLLLWIPFVTYRQYFVRWANNPNTHDAFSANQWELGKYLNNLPDDAQKFVIVNMSGVEVRGIPLPAQTVMFATNTFGEEKQREKNIVYMIPPSFNSSPLVGEETRGGTNNKILIAPLNSDDRELIDIIKKTYPEFQAVVPGNFVIFKNY